MSEATVAGDPGGTTLQPVTPRFYTIELRDAATVLELGETFALLNEAVARARERMLALGYLWAGVRWAGRLVVVVEAVGSKGRLISRRRNPTRAEIDGVIVPVVPVVDEWPETEEPGPEATARSVVVDDPFPAAGAKTGAKTGKAAAKAAKRNRRRFRDWFAGRSPDGGAGEGGADA